VQFAQNPETEELIAVEINPRVSRSSALASKQPVTLSQKLPRNWPSVIRWMN
jgi:carbamoylphosphate synthase large subunit